MCIQRPTWHPLSPRTCSIRRSLRAGTPAIVADFGWAAYDRVIDVAGAHGAVLAGIMAANPRLRGVLFDLPQVVERATEVRHHKNGSQAAASRRCRGRNLRTPSVPAETGTWWIASMPSTLKSCCCGSTSCRERIRNRRSFEFCSYIM